MAKTTSSKRMAPLVASSALLLALVVLYWRMSSTIIRYQEENTTTSLEFAHISKTGGTAIERAAAQTGIPWGICHFESRKDTCFHLRPDLGWPQTFPLRHDIPFPNTTHAEYWQTLVQYKSWQDTLQSSCQETQTPSQRPSGDPKDKAKEAEERAHMYGL